VAISESKKEVAMMATSECGISRNLWPPRPFTLPPLDRDAKVVQDLEGPFLKSAVVLVGLSWLSFELRGENRIPSPPKISTEIYLIFAAKTRRRPRS
jgi:hypothetical protein